MKLSEGQLHVEQWKATKHQHDEVGDEKGPATIGVADIRKPPDITKINSESHHGKEELDFFAPCLSLITHFNVKLFLYYMK